MTDIENIDQIYPVTIVRDRYRGTYSGGLYTAWALDFYQVPQEIDDGDVECANFWHGTKAKEYVGIGRTPQNALIDLYRKFRKHTSGHYYEYESMTMDAIRDRK